MDLEALVDDELIQPLRGAIVAEDMVATRQLIESISTQTTKTETIDEVRVYAEDYILQLRDGTQFENPPSLEDIETWIEAKGLAGTLDPYAVLASILSEGTSWDRQGGSTKLQEVLSPENVQRIMNIAIEENKNEILKTSWLLR
jgi:hypothetical protein